LETIWRMNTSLGLWPNSTSASRTTGMLAGLRSKKLLPMRFTCARGQAAGQQLHEAGRQCPGGTERRETREMLPAARSRAPLKLLAQEGTRSPPVPAAAAAHHLVD
jgi:hypothetical protein